MSIYDSLAPRQAQRTQQEALADLKHDPQGVIKRSGYNVPDGMTDPQQMVNYLINSGQIGGPRLQLAMRMLGRR